MKLYECNPARVGAYCVYGPDESPFYKGEIYDGLSIQMHITDENRKLNFRYIGDGPLDIDELASIPRLTAATEALRDWCVGEVASRVGPARAGDMALPVAARIVDAAVRLGRPERPNLERLDLHGVLAVLNGILQWAGNTPAESGMSPSPAGKNGSQPVEELTRAKSLAKASELSLDARALAVFIEHPDWTKKAIAEHIGCAEKSLAPKRCPKLAAAIAASKAGSLPHGSKDSDGNIEAWDG